VILHGFLIHQVQTSTCSSSQKSFSAKPYICSFPMYGSSYSSPYQPFINLPSWFTCFFVSSISACLIIILILYWCWLWCFDSFVVFSRIKSPSFYAVVLAIICMRHIIQFLSLLAVLILIHHCTFHICLDKQILIIIILQHIFRFKLNKYIIYLIVLSFKHQSSLKSLDTLSICKSQLNKPFLCRLTQHNEQRL
jgi:hypothetical protein